MTALAERGPLLDELRGRRWFAADAEPVAARLTEVVHADADLELALVDVELAGGSARTYLVALAAGGGDALSDLRALRALTRLAGVETPCASVRPAGVEQSNSAVVVDDAVVLKLYRTIERGPGVEAELLGALGRAGLASVPPLRGVLEHGGATLALATGYVASEGDGWELTIAALRAGDTPWLPARARRLGEVTGAMHAALAGAEGPGLEPAPPEPDAVAALAASLREELAAATALPAETTRALLAAVDRAADEAALPELAIRIHGDYHLGQVLWSQAGAWVVIDLEGEPERPLAERRRRALALRDVAGMVRSFAYAADGAALLGGAEASPGWEASCRAAFLDGWRSTVDPRLLPPTEAGAAALLRLLELQKLLYELRYEIAHRPEWVRLPVAGLERILEAS